jgi:hypothetical protein
MDPEFKKIYQELFDSYRAGPVNGELSDEQRSRMKDSLALVGDIIESELPTINLPLRPDARLFLIVNIHQIIALPLSHPDSPTEFSDEVKDELRSDIRDILQSAKKESENRNREEVAASHVLWGISKILDKLKLKSWRIWEKVE